MSAYACEPGKGSEPGVGWNHAKAMAAHHDVWVLTRANNRPSIEAELQARPVTGLSFVYYDLPAWAAWWKRGGRGVQLYYYLWQLGAIRAARAAHRRVGFEVTHHATFVKYWAPAAAAFVGVPFVWGPVGGGESMPRAYFATLGPAGRRYEWMRAAARWLGERDPLVRATGRRAIVAFATTPESAERMARLAPFPAEILSEVALTDEERDRLGSSRTPPPRSEVVFFSAGRLLGWKGYQLSLRAFARVALPNARYVIAGDGPMRHDLEAMALGLDIGAQVDFLGAVPREEVLTWLGRASVFVHPSLHDSGGWATIEAMAAGVPVICLNLGGPGTQVTEGTGRSLVASSVERTIADLAQAMQELGTDSSLRDELGANARARIAEEFTWGSKVARVSAAYAAARLSRSHSRG